MSRRIIHVVVLAISLALLSGQTCVPVQTKTPESVCSAIAACPEYSSVLGAQKTMFQIACPIGLKLVQSRDAACFACLGDNPCDIQNCLDSCNTMIQSVGQFGNLFGTLGVPTYTATEAPDTSEVDVLPAP